MNIYHITWALHATRTSKRVWRFFRIDTAKSDRLLQMAERQKILTYLLDKIKKENYNVKIVNVLPDHVHCILACDKNELDHIVGQLKGYSAFMFNNLANGVLSVAAKGLTPSLPINKLRTINQPRYADGTVNKLWGKRFHAEELSDAAHIYKIVEYIKNNNRKHKCANVLDEVINL